ncbi:MAG: energy-coupled thiamine transporter ThiT [Bacilli bacterium]|nr:energy-coupled thiamine transporter ThiT [Bacilli bacterium]MDD4077852.1 energy-coupled thiamine transporter ThiT [Bacilli bacterium]
MKNKNLRFIAEIGIFTALGLILDFMSGLYSKPLFPKGGSISIAMVPIFIIAFRWGLKGGLTIGFLIGSLQVIYSSVFGYGLTWTVLVLTILLDYILAYTAVGLAGVYTNKIKNSTEMASKLYYITNGILLAGVVRTVLHIVAGWFFYREWVPDFIKENHVWYYWSIIYNLGYMVPSILLCILVTREIVKRHHEKLLNPDVFMLNNIK